MNIYIKCVEYWSKFSESFAEFSENKESNDYLIFEAGFVSAAEECEIELETMRLKLEGYSVALIQSKEKYEKK